METMDNPESHTIEELRRRFQDLNDQKVRAEQDLKNAEQSLGNLKAQAREAFGTDDPGELKAKLQQIEAENLRKRQEYQQSLDKIEASLRKVEADDGETPDEE